MTKQNRGITLVALVITIIVMLMLAGVTISVIVDGGLFDQARNAKEQTAIEGAREELGIILAEYQTRKYTDSTLGTLEDFLESKDCELLKDESTQTKLVVEYKGYEFKIDRETLQIDEQATKAGGVKPEVEIFVTKLDGAKEATIDAEKALTVNIKNVSSYGTNYTIEVKNSSGTLLTEKISVPSGVNGQESYKITTKGTYTILVTGTVSGRITKTTVISKNVIIALPTTETDFATRANGVIEIVWIDTDNKVIDKPTLTSNDLAGLSLVKWADDVTGGKETTTTTPDSTYYSYEAQSGATTTKGTSHWANGKTVKDGNEAYFVWIPRYAYRIVYFNNETDRDDYRATPSDKTKIIGYSNINGMVKVENGTEKLVTGTTPTNLTGAVSSLGYEDYIPHPAFTFGSKEERGFWVGKYEPSGSTDTITIIPNTRSLREKTVSSMFTASQGVKGTYDLSGDSHMMKNTEWGAVAYLTDSKYGRNGTEISINNSSGYYTGRSAGTPGSSSTTTAPAGTYQYNTPNGVLASTTGNIYGIYDMSGGAWEYVMGIYNKTTSSSDFETDLTDIPDTKYYDNYTTYASSKTLKGDATYETSTLGSGSNSWNTDNSNFVSLSAPWFIRRGLLQ